MVSVVDLGIVRDIRYDDTTLVVALTPTYSGCPATAVIARDVEGALRAHGVRSVRVDTQLAPAWTTDWITPRGREALLRAGIAPPGAAAPSPLDGPLVGEIVACPQCGSRATLELSRFGSTPCKALYRCADCSEPFDYVKPH